MESSPLSPALLLGVTACMALLPAVLLAWRRPAAHVRLLLWACWLAGVGGLGALQAAGLGQGAGRIGWLAAGGGWALAALVLLLRPAAVGLQRLVLSLALAVALAALALDSLREGGPAIVGVTMRMDATVGLP